MISFIDLKTQQRQIKKEIDKCIATVLKHQKFILGPEVESLESELTNYTGAKYCITCANGTDALQISLMALDVKPGDEVITPGFSYIATAEAISLLGAKPIYVDVNSETFNISEDLIESHITNKTKVIIPVSLFGRCPDLPKIQKIAKKHNLSVIEDAAQSFGATFKNKKSCNISTISCTSFFPSKPLGCYGDGGAIFTNNSKLAKIIRQISRHGQQRRYHHVRLGLNSRLDTIQAAILLAKLKIFESELELRQKVAMRYEKKIQKPWIMKPKINTESKNTWAQYTIRVPNRDLIQEKMKELGIPTVIHYPSPLNKQPAVSDHSCKLPNALSVSQEVLSLPMHPYLTEKDQNKITDTLQSIRF